MGGAMKEGQVCQGEEAPAGFLAGNEPLQTLVSEGSKDLLGPHFVGGWVVLLRVPALPLALSEDLLISFSDAPPLNLVNQGNLLHYISSVPPLHPESLPSNSLS